MMAIRAGFWSAVFALLVGIVGLWITPFTQSLPLNWRFGASVAAGLLFVAVVLVMKRPARRRWIPAAAALGLVVTAIIAHLFDPSPEEDMIGRYFGICEDPMWGTQPVNCMTESKAYLTTNFDDYAPEAWHTYTPNFGASNITALELAQGGPGLGGTAFRSVGQVVTSQQLGPLEQTIQLRPPTATALDDFKWDEYRAHFSRGRHPGGPDCTGPAR